MNRKHHRLEYINKVLFELILFFLLLLSILRSEVVEKIILKTCAYHIKIIKVIDSIQHDMNVCDPKSENIMHFILIS